MFNRLTKPLVTTSVRNAEPLCNPNTAWKLDPSPQLFDNKLISGIRIFMRVGYFLSRCFSLRLFPEPTLSPPLFFFRQQQAQWSLLPLLSTFCLTTGAAQWSTVPSLVLRPWWDTGQWLVLNSILLNRLFEGGKFRTDRLQTSHKIIFLSITCLGAF